MWTSPEVSDAQLSWVRTFSSLSFDTGHIGAMPSELLINSAAIGKKSTTGSSFYGICFGLRQDLRVRSSEGHPVHLTGPLNPVN